MTFKHTFPVFGLALLAACGGGDQPAGDTAATEGQQPAAEAPAAPVENTPAPAAAAGNVIEVQMITTQGGASGEFQPSQISAKKGDILRFVQAQAGAAHNVNFQIQENSGKPGLPGPSQYVTQAGQTIDVPVTMDAGSYDFQCDPHATMGMKGKLTVTQ